MKNGFIILVVLALILSTFCACTSAKDKAYVQACTLLEGEKYEEAIRAFSDISGFKDSDEKLLIARYQLACDLEAAGDYDTAIRKFKDLGSYSDSATHILSCSYAQALVFAGTGDYSTARDMFLALGNYSDSAEQAAMCLEHIHGNVDAYMSKRVSDGTEASIMGNWAKITTGDEDEYFAFLSGNKCRVMNELTLTKRLSEYAVYTWSFTDGVIKVLDDKGSIAFEYIVTGIEKNKLSVYDKAGLKEMVFKRNTVLTLNAELDSGIVFGMTTEDVIRLETGTLKGESVEHVQFIVNIHDAIQSYSGTRTYYFNSEGKLFKIATTLDASQFTTAQENYAELSAFLNRCFYDVSCADAENTQHVTSVNESYMETCTGIEGITISLWATNSGGMLWVECAEFANSTTPLN